MNKINEEAIKLVIEESKVNRKNSYKDGGPFGAVVVKDNKIITSAHNTVIQDNDPTAHAEINAIREASKKLNTNDLSECILYASAEPCPMCLSAIIWANIKEIYYLNTKEDSDKIGFRDNIIYGYIKGNNQEVLSKHRIDNKEAIEVFKEFEIIQDKEIY